MSRVTYSSQKRPTSVKKDLLESLSPPITCGIGGRLGGREMARSDAPREAASGDAPCNCPVCVCVCVCVCVRERERERERERVSELLSE